MELYTTTLTIIVPETLKPIAAAIGKAIDPDTGGERNFDILKATKDDQTYVLTHAPCIARLASNAAYMLADPEVLFASVSADYAERWPDLVCPTLEDCTAFAQAALCYVGVTLDEAIEAVGMTRVVRTLQTLAESDTL